MSLVINHRGASTIVEPDVPQRRQYHVGAPVLRLATLCYCRLCGTRLDVSDNLRVITVFKLRERMFEFIDKHQLGTPEMKIMTR